MSVMVGEKTGFRPYPRKTLTIQYPTNRYETLLSTPEVLPITEPTTEQVSFTVIDAMLPKWTGKLPYSYSYTVQMIVAGKNTTTTTNTTLSFKTFKNGTLVRSGTMSVSWPRYFTTTFYDFGDVAIGDVLTMKLWAANSATLTLNYKALYVYMTKIKLVPPGDIAAELDVTYTHSGNLTPKYRPLLGVPAETFNAASAYDPGKWDRDFQMGNSLRYSDIITYGGNVDTVHFGSIQLPVGAYYHSYVRYGTYFLSYTTNQDNTSYPYYISHTLPLTFKYQQIAR